MKRLLLPFLIAFFSLNFSKKLQAQPTLTATDLSMQAGDQYLMAEMANPFSPAPPYSYMFFSSPVVGPNQTWNYSALTPLYNFTVGGLNRTAAPLPNEFTSANIVERTGVRYKYLQNTGSKIINWGSVQITPNDTSKWEYDIPYDEIRFPVTAATLYTDTFSYKVRGYYNNICTAIEYFSFETVGYGTLLTPLGTFNSAVLVKTIRELKPDTCGPLNGFAQTTEYKWFAPGYHQPLVCFKKSDTNLGTLYLGYYLQANITGIRKDEFTNYQFQIFPNPATSEVTIQATIKNPSDVKLVLTDALGKEVLINKTRTQADGSFLQQLNVSNLPKGVYMLRLETEGNSAIRKLVLQ